MSYTRSRRSPLARATYRLGSLCRLTPVEALYDGLHYLLPSRQQAQFEHLADLAVAHGRPLPARADRVRLTQWVAALG